VVLFQHCFYELLAERARPASDEDRLIRPLHMLIYTFLNLGFGEAA
jgi:hypothetical protein